MNYNLNKDPLFKILEATAIDRLGILALPRTVDHHDVNRTLDETPGVDARATKRKFRKAWRKAARRLLAAAANKSRVSGVRRYVTGELGLGSPAPTRKHKLARKREVAAMVRAEATIARKALMSPT